MFIEDTSISPFRGSLSKEFQNSHFKEVLRNVLRHTMEYCLVKNGRHWLQIIVVIVEISI